MGHRCVKSLKLHSYVQDRYVKLRKSSSKYHERTEEGERTSGGRTQEGFMEEAAFELGWLASSIYW